MVVFGLLFVPIALRVGLIAKRLRGAGQNFFGAGTVLHCDCYQPISSIRDEPTLKSDRFYYRWLWLDSGGKEARNRFTILILQVTGNGLSAYEIPARGCVNRVGF